MLGRYGVGSGIDRTWILSVAGVPRLDVSAGDAAKGLSLVVSRVKCEYSPSARPSGTECC